MLTQTSELAEIMVDEGERVGTGDVVARIYSSSESYELQQELDEANARLESLNYILSRAGESSDTAELDEDIVSSFTGLRYAVSSGDLSSLSSDADELRSLIFRRDYLYSGSDTLSAQISEAEALVTSLEAQTGSSYTTVTATASGLFSGTVDGYESVFTTAALEGLTPSTLTRLAGSQQETDSAALGKIITSSGWYFACNLAEDEISKIYVGATVTLRFAESSRTYDAEVTRVSDAENGMVTVVFYSRNYAELLVSLRSQSVDIITGTATGFRVPKRAVRVNEDGEVGVYRVYGAQTTWVPVNILWEEDDYYLVEQTVAVDEDGNEVELTSLEKASRLREGDTIIVKGSDIYEGKVIED